MLWVFRWESSFFLDETPDVTEAKMIISRRSRWEGCMNEVETESCFPNSREIRTGLGDRAKKTSSCTFLLTRLLQLELELELFVVVFLWKTCLLFLPFHLSWLEGNYLQKEPFHSRRIVPWHSTIATCSFVLTFFNILSFAWLFPIGTPRKLKREGHIIQ